MPVFPFPITADGVVKGIDQFDDLADTIANPPAGRPLRQAIGQTGQKICDFIGAVPNGASASLGPAFKAASLACKPYWDSKDYDAPVPAPPPFEGGQCGFKYIVGTKGIVCPTANNDFSSFASGPGPISSITLAITPRPNFPANRLSTWTVAFADTNRTFQTAHNEADVMCYRVFPLNAANDDNCGDPEPEEPFAPGENPPPVPPGITPGEDFGTDPITGQPFFFVPPIENPTDPDGPGVDFDPDEPGAYPGPPEANPAGGDEGIGPGEEVGGGAGGTGDDSDFGEPPEGRVWVGAIAHFVAPSSYGNISGTGPGNTVYPRVVGNLSLIYGDVRGQASQVRSEWFDMVRPTDALPVTGARANKLPGVACTVYPLSAPICPDGVPCEVE